MLGASGGELVIAGERAVVFQVLSLVAVAGCRLREAVECRLQLGAFLGPYNRGSLIAHVEAASVILRSARAVAGTRVSALMVVGLITEVVAWTSGRIEIAIVVFHVTANVSLFLL
jgi:hypothetical protein